MISFACTHCGMKLQVKPEFAGRASRCPTCKQPLVVPAPSLTQANVNAGAIEGTSSSLAQAGMDGGVTLESGNAAARGPTTSIRDLLARRPKNSARYITAQEIARGGMGAVLRAVDCDIRREVAVKYLLDQADPRKKARFVEEAQITGQLEHPNIVPIHELAIDAQKRLFFSMKMVKGRSLAQVLDELRKNPKSPDFTLGRLLNVLVSVCNALAYAHSCGVVHRDLKPANIMIGDFGEVYVMDWGLAKVLKESEVRGQKSEVKTQELSRGPEASGVISKVDTSRAQEADLTQDGAILGTPVYMPPEQATGKLQAIDQRSDIYSLGAILYEILTLQPPVDKEGGYMAILMRVMEGAIVPPERRNPQRARAGLIPLELSAVAMKALAKQPADRYASVAALRQDIERFQEGRSVSAKDDTFRETVWKLVKRNRGASVTALIALVVLTLGLWFSFRGMYNAYSSMRQEQDAKRDRGKKSAPLFFQDAQVSAQRGKVEHALAQVTVALDYDPDIVEAQLLKGQLLIANRDFGNAQKELELYTQRQPNDKDAALLLELCRQVRPDDSRVLGQFVSIFERQRAYGLAEHLEQDQGKLLRLYRQRVETAWPGLSNRLEMDKDGRCSLNLSHTKEVEDLTPLRGLPLGSLDLWGCDRVKDLTPLEGMPLTMLSLRGCEKVRDLKPISGLPIRVLYLENCTGIQDLTPLHGMKIAQLHLTGCKQVRDLAPLRGLPLSSLSLHGLDQITELTPLQDTPLRHLDIGFCPKLKDLAVLQKLPLTSLNLNGWAQLKDLSIVQGLKLTHLNLGSAGVRDLTALRGMPLTSLQLAGCYQVRDLTPLSGMKLTDISIIPKQITSGLDVLREMKTLKIIGVPQNTRLSAEDFWKRYDAGEFK